jgi:predicted alpha/beta superfamily hydrolase
MNPFCFIGRLILLLFLTVIGVNVCFARQSQADAEEVINDSVTITIIALPDNHPWDEDVYIAGDFNNWNPGDTTFRMKRNSDKTYSIELTGKGTTNYKFTRGTWGTVEKGSSCNEISNRSLSFEGSSTVTNTVFNWSDLCGGSHTATSNVSVINGQFTIPQLNRTRKIWIYLPTGYSTSAEKYPVLYMHDGQNLFDAYYSFAGEWGIDESMNTLISKGDKGCIVVGIDNGGETRIDEYSPYTHPTYGGGEGDLYARFLVETLKPYIDANYRTLSDRDNTAIMGSSMGGLISFYTGLKYQNIFSKIGIFSPAFWFSKEYYTFASNTPNTHPVRLYFLGGGLESGVIDECKRMIDTLTVSGYSVDGLKMAGVPGGAHNEAFWRSEFPGAYKWLFSSPTGSALKKESVVRLFPNPVTNQLTIIAPTEFVGNPFTIYNVSGDELINGRIVATEDSINIETLPKGNYLFSIGAYERQTFKLVKE